MKFNYKSALFVLTIILGVSSLGNMDGMQQNERQRPHHGRVTQEELNEISRCAICWGELSINDNLMVLNCRPVRHIFHADCVQTLQKCPVCLKTAIPQPPERPLSIRERLKPTPQIVDCMWKTAGVTLLAFVMVVIIYLDQKYGNNADIYSGP